MNEIKVLAPAKVNLFLGIGETRDDGYHNATTIMHALALHDVLSIVALSADTFHPQLKNKQGYDLDTIDVDGISVGVEMVGHEGIDANILLEDNLVVKAVHSLASACGTDWKGYVRITIDKHIPMQAGLGGGSSDCAAALLGVSQVFGLEADDPAILETAKALGTDIAFFLRGGCGLYNGRGENFVRALDPMREPVVLLMPEGAAVSTAEAYKTFSRRPFPLPPEAMRDAYAVDDSIEAPIFNNLANASYLLKPELEQVRRWARAQEGVEDVLLCGSGACTFAITDNADNARLLAVHAQKKGWWARTTNFARLGVAVLPKISLA